MFVCVLNCFKPPPTPNNSFGGGEFNYFMQYMQFAQCKSGYPINPFISDIHGKDELSPNSFGFPVSIHEHLRPFISSSERSYPI
jgi:hypothetical protein